MILMHSMLAGDEKCKNQRLDKRLPALVSSHINNLKELVAPDCMAFCIVWFCYYLLLNLSWLGYTKRQQRLRSKDVN